ncbi:MAG: DNA-processing protein DprA, partial [Solirubrobacteraceae bacterium]
MPHELQQARACRACLTRAFLLRALSARLEHSARDLAGLLALLDKDDLQLIEAIGGRRRDELRFRIGEIGRLPPSPRGGESICPHCAVSPPPPTGLHLAPGLARYRQALTQPLVAILGSVRASEYATGVAATLAADLSCAGITVGALLLEGVAAAAHGAALAGGGVPLAVCAGGLDRCPAHLRSLHRRLRRNGCLVAELPLGAEERRWTRRAAGRVLVALADLVLVVEGEPDGL